MVSSTARTVGAYLASLPPERRDAVARVRAVVNAHLPRGFEEGMQYGMISWYVPLSRLAETYDGQPLAIVSLASQKQSMSLYLMGAYGDPEERARFEKASRKSGKKLDMGKSCLRFKTIDDLPLDALGDALARITVDRFVATYEASRAATAAAKRAKTKTTASKKPTATAAPAKKKMPASTMAAAPAPKKKPAPTKKAAPAPAATHGSSPPPKKSTPKSTIQKSVRF